MTGGEIGFYTGWTVLVVCCEVTMLVGGTAWSIACEYSLDRAVVWRDGYLLCVLGLVGARDKPLRVAMASVESDIDISPRFSSSSTFLKHDTFVNPPRLFRHFQQPYRR